MKIIQYSLKISVFVLFVAHVCFAQTTSVTVDLPPGLTTAHYADPVDPTWIPDCSQQSLTLPTQDLYSYSSNSGNARLDPEPLLWVAANRYIMKNRSPYGINSNPFDRAFTGVSDGSNGAVFAFEKYIHTSQFGNNNTDSIITDATNPIAKFVGYKVAIQGVNSSGSLVSPSFLVDGAVTAQIMPKIINSGSSYIVVYVSANPDQSTSNTQPYKIMACKFSSSGSITWGPLAVTGSDTYFQIPEFSIESDQSGGVMVLAVVKKNTSDSYNRILLQDVASSTGSVSHSGLSDDGASGSMGVVDNSSYYKYHPIIKYNGIYSKYDIAYAIVLDNPVIDPALNPNPKATLYFCKYVSGTLSGPLTSSKKLDYSYGGSSAMTEFYMTPFSNQGSAAEAVLAKDDNGYLQLWEFDMSTISLLVTHTPIAPQTVTGTPTVSNVGDANVAVTNCSSNPATKATASIYAFPGGIINDGGSPNHLIITYYDDPSGTGGSFTAYSEAFNTTTGLAWTNWPYVTGCSSNVVSNPVSIKSGITSTLFETSMNLYSGSVFVIVPDATQQYVAKINSSSGSVTYSTTVIARSLNQTVYSTSLLSGSNLLRCNYESEITTLQDHYFTRFDFDLRKFTTEREHYALNSDLNVESYSTSSSSLTANFSNDALLCNTKMHHGLHSAAFENLEASVWETWSPGGVSDIYLAKRGSTPVQITSGSSQTSMNINPKVGVFYYSGTPYAVVTYINETSSLGTYYSNLEYRIVNLSTMSVGSQTFIDGSSSASYPLTGYNIDLVQDSVTGCFFSVYGKNFDGKGYVSSPQQSDLFAARINYSGSVNWSGVGISQALDVAWKSEVATCYTSNNVGGVTSPGIYVAWRGVALGNEEIMLQWIDATGATWSGGPISHNLGNDHRHNPAVAASDTWVMLAWDDTFDDAFHYANNPNHVPRVVATGHYSNGNFLPGWNNPVILDSASIPPITGEMDDYYESYKPSIVASIASDADTNKEGCLVAFTEDNDADGWEEFIGGNQKPSFNMRIGLRFIWARRVIDSTTLRDFPQAKNLQWSSPNPSPSNGKTLALFGTVQQNAKLIQMKPGSFPAPPASAAGAPWFDANHTNPLILCAFETMPTNRSEFRNIERYATLLSMIQCANLDARLITAYGDASGEQYCIASQSGKQILGNITHTKELGFLASYLDYDNSDNYSADIRNVSVNNKVFYSIPTITVSGTYGTPNSLLASGSTNVTLYNQSPITMPINTLGASSALFSVSGPTTVSGFSTGTMTVTYVPDTFGYTRTATIGLLIREGTSGTSTLVAPADTSSATNSVTGNKIAYGNIGGNGLFSISESPNPATDRITVTINGCDGKVSLGIYDLLGRKMKAQIFESKENVISIPIPLDQFPSGSYYLRAVMGGLVQEQLISIVR